MRKFEGPRLAVAKLIFGGILGGLVLRIFERHETRIQKPTARVTR